MIPPLSLSNTNDFEMKEKKSISSKTNNTLKPILEEDEKHNLGMNKNILNNYIANSSNNQNDFSNPTEEKRLKTKLTHVIKKSSLLTEKKTINENIESSAETSSNDNFSNSLFSNSDSDYLKNKKKKRKN